VFFIRAIIALLLIVGFYSLALALIAVLLYVPYASWVYRGYFSPGQSGFCVFSVLTIAYAVWPRREHFLAPGPRLDLGAHPKLRALLIDVAQATNQVAPEELYLIPEVNAWVSRRGGRTFSGGRRVMGLGLPLLAVLTPTQLRAVLAHEFGHEEGGDTVLGGWIYGARMAMIRTGQEIWSSGWSGVLMIPLTWYSKLFLRMTTAIARHQELTADGQAARISGPEVAGQVLMTVEAATISFDRYLRSEVFPVLERGYRPPLAAGFAHYFRNQENVDGKEAVEQPAALKREDPYQSHPPLKERLAALGFDPATRRVANEEPSALSLLETPESFEPDLLGRLTNQTVSRRAKPIAWENLARPEGIELIHGKTWDALLTECGSGLSGTLAPDLAGLAADPEALGRKLTRRKMLSKDYARLASQVVGIALARALSKAGWSMRREPGVPIRLQKGTITLEPFEIFDRLRENAFSADWLQECGRLGISSLDLGSSSMNGGQDRG
jgi:Zn-dependent protease with chaperone function